MSWRDKARELIARVYLEQQAANVTEPKAIARAIDEAYPFGPRKCWPYKAWLAARREFFTQHQLPQRELRRNQQTASLFAERPDTNTVDLFDGLPDTA